MNFIQSLFSKMLFRNMLTDFGYRLAYSNIPGDFTPYFAYKIGRYENGYYLNFPKEPLALPYKNEIFNKLHRYDNEAIGKYLDFHFELYPDKRDFLRFLYYELSERIHQNVKSRMFKLNTALEWTISKQEEQRVNDVSLSSQQKETIREEIQKTINNSAQNQNIAFSPLPEQEIQLLAEKLSGQMEAILKERMENESSAATEQLFGQMNKVFRTGNIELHNTHNKARLIQLFILLQEVLTPATGKNRELVFKKLSAIDIAAILKLHFADFKDLQLNTIQKDVSRFNGEMKQDSKNSARIRNLESALSEFFY